MTSTETASSLFRDECKVILVQGGGSEWRSCNLTFVCFTTGFTIVIQAEISPPLTVKESRFNTIWLQFSLIIITATCRHMQKAAHLLETYKCIVQVMIGNECLRSLVGRALRARSKSLCVASVWPCFRRKEAYFSHTDFSWRKRLSIVWYNSSACWNGKVGLDHTDS